MCEADLAVRMRAASGREAAAGRAAGRRDREAIPEADAVGRRPIEVRAGDIGTTLAVEVGAQIVTDDMEYAWPVGHVRSFGRQRRLAAGGAPHWRQRARTAAAICSRRSRRRSRKWRMSGQRYCAGPPWAVGRRNLQHPPRQMSKWRHSGQVGGVCCSLRSRNARARSVLRSWEGVWARMLPRRSAWATKKSQG